MKVNLVIYSWKNLFKRRILVKVFLSDDSYLRRYSVRLKSYLTLTMVYPFISENYETFFQLDWYPGYESFGLVDSGSKRA